ncbi:MAG: divergent polysaccharide deacetylase family protein [SAR324 cluster bacterium]|nr:divergent polysaccharide deacetylase family protein [SAR324 cluster bacterium]
MNWRWFAAGILLASIPAFGVGLWSAFSPLNGEGSEGSAGSGPALAMVSRLPETPPRAASQPPPDQAPSRPFRRPAERPPQPEALPRPDREDARREDRGPRLAVVIDDIGHNLGRPRAWLDLDLPVTFSILPALPHSAQAAAMIRARGREYLIHLPMEPEGFPAVNPGGRPLLLKMDAAATTRRLREYFSELPDAVGASNHMGSAYTYDGEKMAVVQATLALRKLFFLNSLTSPSRLPRQIARRSSFPYLERNIFLDNQRGGGSIKRQLERAIAIARKHGRAIAIGHPYPQTLRVLRRAFPTPEQQGVTLVPLSRLAGS